MDIVFWGCHEVSLSKLLLKRYQAFEVSEKQISKVAINVFYTVFKILDLKRLTLRFVYKNRLSYVYVNKIYSLISCFCLLTNNFLNNP